MKLEDKYCSKANQGFNHCWGIKCVQFTSCMITEAESMEDLGVNSCDFVKEVKKIIEEDLA